MKDEEETYLTLKHKHFAAVPVTVGMFPIPANTTYWLNDDRLVHRIGAPAIYCERFELWVENGKLHRSFGKPAVIHYDERREYWLHGYRHRLDGPAIDYLVEDVLHVSEHWHHGIRKHNVR